MCCKNMKHFGYFVFGVLVVQKNALFLGHMGILLFRGEMV